MKKLTLVIGGARSGKSAAAEQLAGYDRKVAYVATGRVLDDETRERVRRHQARRPRAWRTFEQQLELDRLVPQLAKEYDVILVDCALLYVTNLFLGQEENPATEADILAAVERLLRACREAEAEVVLVSGEVGCGIVPENALARRFRDVMGRVNQRLAEKADEVYHVVAGIPLRIKPASPRVHA
jgi:adenosylcobinamide kinase/adenosylcobinamide-phosphate guanylyltransferase